MDNLETQFSTVWLRESGGDNASDMVTNRKEEFASQNVMSLHAATSRPPPPVPPGQGGDVRYRYMRVQHTDPLDATNKTVTVIPLLMKRPFVCQECQRAFASQGALRKHLSIHSNVKPYVCEVCGQTFLLSSYLKRHMLSHSSDRPFNCDECALSFLTSSALRVHRMAHTGERPHRCAQCGKSFTTASYLVVHRRVHTGEKPYSCKVCGKAFARRCNLRAHAVSHTREKPHHCGKCDARFQFRTHLDHHLRTAHIERERPNFATGAQAQMFDAAGHLARHSDSQATHATQSLAGGSTAAVCVAPPAASTAAAAAVAGGLPPLQLFMCQKCGVVSERLAGLCEHWRVCYAGYAAEKVRVPAIAEDSARTGRTGDMNNSTSAQSSIRHTKGEPPAPGDDGADGQGEYNFEEDSFEQRPVVCEDCGATLVRTADLEAHVLAHVLGLGHADAGHAIKQEPEDSESEEP